VLFVLPATASMRVHLFVALCQPQLRFRARNGDVHLSQVKVLLQGGAKIDRADSHGQTGLHHATLRGRTQMVDVLLKLGANPLTPDRRRMTSLHCAAYAGHVRTRRIKGLASCGSLLLCAFG